MQPLMCLGADGALADGSDRVSPVAPTGDLLTTPPDWSRRHRPSATTFEGYPRIINQWRPLIGDEVWNPRCFDKHPIQRPKRRSGNFRGSSASGGARS